MHSDFSEWSALFCYSCTSSDGPVIVSWYAIWVILEILFLINAMFWAVKCKKREWLLAQITDYWMSHVDCSHVCGKITSLPSSGFSIYTILGQLPLTPFSPYSVFLFKGITKQPIKETHGRLFWGPKGKCYEIKSGKMLHLSISRET